MAEALASENKDELEDETKVKESEMGEYKTPHQGIGVEVTTRPTPVGLIPGVWAGGGVVMTNKFGIDEATLLEEEKRLELEVRHCEMVLKRAKVESMRNEINKLSLEKTNQLSGFQDSRDRGQVSLCSSLVQRQSRGKPYDLHYFQQGGLSRSGTLVIQLRVRFLRDAGARKEA